jgi:hypothetical protein
MEQFRIRQDGFKDIRKAMLIRTIPLALFAAVGGLAIGYYNSAGQEGDNTGLLVSIPFILLVLAFGLYRAVNRQKEIFNSYRLTIEQDGIRREQQNTPTIYISNTDLNEIVKHLNGSFTIKGNSSVDVILVPSQVENYEKLENLLSGLKPISAPATLPFLQKIRGLASVVVIALMAAVYISKDKMIVGVCGTLLLIAIGYSLFEIQRNKNVDHKTKRGMWVLIFVIASVIGVMYFKLTAP